MKFSIITPHDFNLLETYEAFVQYWMATTALWHAGNVGA